MDKNSLIGLSIIATILGVWLYMSGPSKEQIARNKEIRDSINRVEKIKENVEATKIAKNLAALDTVKLSPIVSDSSKKANQINKYKDFTVATVGKLETYIIENENLKATISNKGGVIEKVELKKYHRYLKKENLILFDKDSTRFAIKLSCYDRSSIFNTDEFFFKTIKKTDSSITIQLQTSIVGSYIEYNYALKKGSYVVDSEIRFVGMQNIISHTEDQLQLIWNMMYPSQEKNIIKEKESATIYFKQNNISSDNINPANDEEKELSDADIKWISFRQQFFNATIIADNFFNKGGSFIKISQRPNSESIVKAAFVELGMPYNHNPIEKFKYQFYFGPNEHQTLENFGHELESIVPTGWSIFSYINKWLVIPLFRSLNFLNMGLVILILTIILKVILLPIAYKTYMSGAKMRVLKPETDALAAKYEKNPDPMKKQQDQMALYRKAGVNPLSGCIPLLLQFPILIALFAFIPASIELRQQGFLWSDDLSTYDSILNFGTIPFISWAYGDHISLFALLMFVSTIIYTYLNSSMMPQQGSTQMPGMKFMMYFMPVIFLAVMNKYAAGLSWYYFLANMFTFLQNFIIKKFVSDGKIRTQLEANMLKPVKISNFQKRLADMSKQRQLASKKK